MKRILKLDALCGTINLALGPVALPIPVKFIDVVAGIDVTTRRDYHFVERGHWCNGYFPDHEELEPGTVDVYEALITLPWLARIAGGRVELAVSDWIQGKYCDRIKAHVAGFLAECCDDYDWCEEY